MRLNQAAKRLVIGVILVGGLVSGCSEGSSDGGSASVPLGTKENVADDETTSTVSEGTERPLFAFQSVDSANGWSVVNDTVMGGVSSGRLRVDDGLLIFDGELSLENNGGFASVRSPLLEPQSANSWSNQVGPRIMAVGDGRTWTFEVRTDDIDGGWIASLPTTPGSKTEVVVPWTTFEPVTRFLDPRVAEGPLDPSRIVSIAFYLVDGEEGSFQLGIESIS